MSSERSRPPRFGACSVRTKALQTPSRRGAIGDLAAVVRLQRCQNAWKQKISLRILRTGHAAKRIRWMHHAAYVTITASMVAAEPHTVLLWFRNDLRLHDNAMVHEAAQRAATDPRVKVLPMYCFEPQMVRQTSWGHSKMGPFRGRFLLESVMALRASLHGIGSDLLTVACTPEQAVSELLATGGLGQLTALTQQEVTSEECAADAAVQDVLSGHGTGQLITLWGSTLLHRDDWPFDAQAFDLPDSFTKFRKKVEEPHHWRVRSELPSPGQGELPLPQGGLPQIPSACEPRTLADLFALANETGTLPEEPDACAKVLDSQAVMQFSGGEAAALERLQHYTWGSDAVAHYIETRNGLMAADDSSKLSPWLAAGCLSPRRVYREVQRYEMQRTANTSTRMLVFHLLVRDWFRLFCLKHGRRVFWKHGITDERRSWRGDATALQRWRDGVTGIPFVDAHMRELQQTGWMSNRGRQNAASFLAHDAGCDWRGGAAWFEARLVDHDVCSNWGNWVAAAGLAPGRASVFNIVKQGRDYDPEGRYIRQWVPELAGVPAEDIHQPWRMTAEQQVACGVRLPQQYSLPIEGTRYTEGK